MAPIKSETEGFKPKEDPNKKKIPPVFPLLSISGLTLLSFGGLVLLKGNSATQNDLSSQNTSIKNNPAVQEPTQVPKSIQHYLLTSQQYFSQAVSQQSTDNSSAVELLNNSILAATEAIKEFPDDYRGYQQRGNIYQALTDSKPELLDQSISDFASAFKLNSQSAEVTRSLASLYAKKGDANKTILYLNQTVALEPTKAQNFYDLAKIQQQAGLLSQALDTYNKLTTLVTDPTQKTQVESEKAALEKLVAQNPNSPNRPHQLIHLRSTIYLLILTLLLFKPWVKVASSSPLQKKTNQLLSPIKVTLILFLAIPLLPSGSKRNYYFQRQRFFYFPSICHYHKRWQKSKPSSHFQNR